MHLCHSCLFPPTLTLSFSFFTGTPTYLPTYVSHQCSWLWLYNCFQPLLVSSIVVYHLPIDGCVFLRVCPRLNFPLFSLQHSSAQVWKKISSSENQNRIKMKTKFSKMANILIHYFHTIPNCTYWLKEIKGLDTKYGLSCPDTIRRNSFIINWQSGCLRYQILLGSLSSTKLTEWCGQS